jgi:hypothetical protein
MEVAVAGHYRFGLACDGVSRLSHDREAGIQDQSQDQRAQIPPDPARRSRTPNPL